MNKKEFKEKQPVVYQTLSNALKKERLAHAYLFEGDKSAPKQDVALLFAQSLVCQHSDEDGFACQECDSCHQISNRNYIDLKWVDGFDAKSKKARIKKGHILDLMEYFGTTSLEKTNRRIYVLDGFDQATPDASNSLLKFLEEPAPGIYGILLADEKSNVLPTIQSRCQLIHFKPASKEDIVNELLEYCDAQSARMLADSGYTTARAIEIISHEEFEVIKQSALEYVENLSRMEQVLKLQTEVFISKGSLTQEKWIRLWLEWVLFKIKKNAIELPLIKQAKIQTILVESMDILRRPVDLSLFMDKIYYDIRKVVME